MSGMSSERHSGTRRMGLILGLQSITDRCALLQEMDDTTWGADLGAMRRIAAEEGFVGVHAHRFADMHAHPGAPERHEILWHPDGVILCADTWDGSHINSATLWFNLEVDAEAMDRPSLPFSHGRVVEHAGGHLWIGHAGADEGLRFQMAALRALGRLRWPWVARPEGFTLLDRSEIAGANRPEHPDERFMCEMRARTSPILTAAWGAPA